MLRNDSAEYISEDEVMIMRPLLPEFYNASYSWNTHAGCSNTLFFTGKPLSTALRLHGSRRLFSVSQRGLRAGVEDERQRLTRTGSAITAYGLAGPRSGNFSVTVDGETTLHSALASEADYAHVLFAIDNLEADKNHSLTMTNLEDHRWFGFDYALVTVEADPSPAPST